MMWLGLPSSCKWGWVVKHFTVVGGQSWQGQGCITDNQFRCTSSSHEELRTRAVAH